MVDCNHGWRVVDESPRRRFIGLPAVQTLPHKTSRSQQFRDSMGQKETSLCWEKNPQ